jgi:hypothetical protein
MSVDVAAGNAWIAGHYFTSSAIVTLPIAAPAAGKYRWDAIVVRFDFLAGTRALTVVSGTESSNALLAGEPVLVQNTTTKYDLPLAAVFVRPAATSIQTVDDAANGYVLDRRFYVPLPDVDAAEVTLVRAATAAALATSGGGDYRYGTALGALTVDGVAMAAGDLFLDKSSTAGNRGVYLVEDPGAAARSYRLRRLPGWTTTDRVAAGSIVAVAEGTRNAGTAWVLANAGAITVGTTVLTFSPAGPPKIPWHAEWTIGLPGVPSGATNFVNPFDVWVPTGWTRTLEEVAHGIRGGTSVAWDLRKASTIAGVTAGTAVTGYSTLSSTTTRAKTTSSQPLADGDLIAPVPSAVTATPDNWTVRASGLLTFTG